MNSELKREVKYIKGVGEKRAQQLNRLGIFTLEDLLYHIPRRYIDYSDPMPIAYAPYDEMCAVKATVLDAGAGIRIRGGRKLFRVVARDESATLTITFFNSEYTVRQLVPGNEYIFWGKLGGSMLSRTMTTPLFIPADAPLKRQAVYPLTAGLSAKQISTMVKNAFDIVGHLDDPIPEQIRDRYSLMDLDSALRGIHFPKSDEELGRSIDRLAFEELFYLQLGMSMLNASYKKQTGVRVENIDISPLLRSLPYDLTTAQNRAISDILNDFLKDTSMNRLLQGDVGSGKTIVAMAAMYCMKLNGYQSCMMAPTEILANQHYESFVRTLESLGVRIGLLTASVKGKRRKEVLAALENGQIDILVGTHAILSEEVVFSNLGLTVTDEQHRFGVNQRNLVSLKGDNPHILVMSATPIPRTLAMIIYVGMEISIIDEMPAGRLPVKTYLVDSTYRERMYGFVDRHIKMGYQTYVVLPAIDENEEMTDMQSVVKYCDETVKKLLPNARVGILHGRMKAAEKDRVMGRFVRGELDILCSTTVIEVGVDVPNAVIMIIENAERYGLSAMHQLRGRVGRNDIQSYCILVSDKKSKPIQDRLKFLAANNSGFEISQYDLEHRGPGDFFGSAQHGLPVMKTANLVTDLDVMKTSREASNMIIERSPDLAGYPRIKEKCGKMFGTVTL